MNQFGTVAYYTLGCKLNFSESLFGSRGFDSRVPSGPREKDAADAAMEALLAEEASPAHMLTLFRVISSADRRILPQVNTF